MRFGSLLPLILIASVGQSASAAPADERRIDRAVAVVKELCLVGKQFDLSADASGNLTFRSLRPGGQGSVSVNVRESEGATAIFDQRLRVIADAETRACIEPHIPRIVDAILGDSSRPRSDDRQTGFRVIDVHESRARPDRHRGRCPVEIKFKVRVSVAGGAGTVSYRWLRSDGANAPIETIRFSEPGSKDIEDYWQIGGRGSSYDGWKQLQIYDPEELRSDRILFSVRCD
jgi:hypothetical protein